MRPRLPPEAPPTPSHLPREGLRQLCLVEAKGLGVGWGRARNARTCVVNDHSNPRRSPGGTLRRSRNLRRGEPQRLTNPRPDLPKARNDVSASRARGPRPRRESVTGHGARGRKPSCRHSQSEGCTHRTSGLSWVVRAAVKM